MNRCPPRQPNGFTLIEVIGALVIFSMGVLMVIQTSGALTTQMRNAATRSTIAVLANEWLDSLEATPFDSLNTGVIRDNHTVEAIRYRRRAVVTQVTPVLYQIDMRVRPIGGADGPIYRSTSYRSGVW